MQWVTKAIRIPIDWDDFVKDFMEKRPEPSISNALRELIRIGLQQQGYLPNQIVAIRSSAQGRPKLTTDPAEIAEAQESQRRKEDERSG